MKRFVALVSVLCFLVMISGCITIVRSPDDLASSGLNENTSQGEANLPRDAKVLHEEAIKASNEAALKELVENCLALIDEVLEEEASIYQQWFDCVDRTGKEIYIYTAHEGYPFQVESCSYSAGYYEKVLALQQFVVEFPA